MPALIEYMDAIAREVDRDVLFLNSLCDEWRRCPFASDWSCQRLFVLLEQRQVVRLACGPNIRIGTRCTPEVVIGRKIDLSPSVAMLVHYCDRVAGARI